MKILHNYIIPKQYLTFILRFRYKYPSYESAPIIAHSIMRLLFL